MSDSASVRAGGGIVLRDGRVLLVHRAHYDDWSLPKGKLEPGETWTDAALREVEEETGLRCALGEEAGRSYYTDAAGRGKEVRYYLMSSSDEAVACNEIDEVRWVPLAEAPQILSYPRDAVLLAALLTAP